MFSLIVADDGRHPRQSVPSTVTISITNLNDEEPVFEESTYSESCDTLSSPDCHVIDTHSPHLIVM